MPAPLTPLVVAAVAFLLTSCSNHTNPGSPPPFAGGPKPGSSHLAVADYNNGRVLIFDAPFTTGESASVVLGQPDFTQYGGPLSPALLDSPSGLALDSNGNLYAADHGLFRVVEFGAPFASGMNAALEVGAESFNSPGGPDPFPCPSAGAATLCGPMGATLDVNGNLWVADLWNGRIVEYQQPLKQAMPGSVVIGQPSLSVGAECDGVDSWLQDSVVASMTDHQLCDPTSAAFDAGGNLWVADTGNSRVLEFTPPFSTGMAASLEIGYPASAGMNIPYPAMDCSKTADSATAGNFCGPTALAFDAHGSLWVSDGDYNRVLRYDPPFTSGMSASLVIGHPDFTHNDVFSGTPSSASARTLYYPNGITFDLNGNLILADSGDNRVLIFSPPFSNGMSASVVLGQPNMTWYGCNGQFQSRGADDFCSPMAVLAF